MALSLTKFWKKKADRAKRSVAQLKAESVSKLITSLLEQASKRGQLWTADFDGGTVQDPTSGQLHADGSYQIVIKIEAQ